MYVGKITKCCRSLNCIVWLQDTAKRNCQFAYTDPLGRPFVKFVSAFPLSLALVLVLQAHGAQAQVSEEDELSLVYGDKSSISLATGSQQSLRRAPAVATVITSQDIAAMGATDLDQVLESVAGIHVNRSPNQYSPLYVVRGIVSPYTPQVLVLQNGIPMTTLYQSNKGNVWGGYPVEHIARIEIIRGPGSALYGSDAYSGVINIITKNAADAAGTEIGARAGSFGTRDAWIQHGGKLGNADVAGYLRVGRTDGFRSIIDADAQTRNDTLFHTNASLAPGPVNTGNDAIDGNLDIGLEKWRFRAGYKLRDNVGTGAGIGNALDPVGKSRSERITTEPVLDRPANQPRLERRRHAVDLVLCAADPVGLPVISAGDALPDRTVPGWHARRT